MIERISCTDLYHTICLHFHSLWWVCNMFTNDVHWFIQTTALRVDDTVSHSDICIRRWSKSKGSVCSLYLALQRDPTLRKVSVFNTNRGLYSSYYPTRDLPRPLKPLQSVISSLTNYCLSCRLRKLHSSTTIVWYISGTSVHMQPFCFRFDLPHCTNAMRCHQYHS